MLQGHTPFRLTCRPELAGHMIIMGYPACLTDRKSAGVLHSSPSDKKQEDDCHGLPNDEQGFIKLSHSTAWRLCRWGCCAARLQSSCL